MKVVLQVYGIEGSLDLVPIIGLLEESGVEYTASYTTKERDNIEVPVLPEPSSGDKTKTVKDVPLPALFHSISPGNEVTIFGRTAILRYVAEQFRLEYFYPKEASERATADLALDFYSTAFYPAAQSLLAKGDWASAKPTVETEAVKLADRIAKEWKPTIDHLTARGQGGTIGNSGCARPPAPRGLRGRRGRRAPRLPGLLGCGLLPPCGILGPGAPADPVPLPSPASRRPRRLAPSAFSPQCCPRHPSLCADRLIQHTPCACKRLATHAPEHTSPTHTLNLCPPPSPATHISSPARGSVALADISLLVALKALAYRFPDNEVSKDLAAYAEDVRSSLPRSGAYLKPLEKKYRL